MKSKVVEITFDEDARENMSFNAEVRQLILDMAEAVANDKYGKQIFAAVVMINDKHEVATAYAGRAHIFTTLGALQHMANRISQRQMEDEYDLEEQ